MLTINITRGLTISAILTVLLITTQIRNRNTHQPRHPPSSSVRRLQAIPPQPQNQDEPNEEKVAVAVLIPNTYGDVIDLCLSLRSISSYAVVPDGTHVLVFHESDFPQDRADAVAKCSGNPTFFHEVNLGYDFVGPEFTATLDRLGLLVSRMGQAQGRDRWGYVGGIRFWTSLVWEHEAVRNYDVIMRIDTDSCFKGPSAKEVDSYLPSIPPQYVFRSNGPYLGSNVWVKGLYDFAVQYIEKEEIEPLNPELWSYIQQAHEKHQTMPVFQKNFEVMRKSFFKRYDVMKWHKALTEGEPYGVLRYRWGEGQTSVLTMALFGTKDNILMTRHEGYSHGRGVCAEYVGVKSGWEV